jgi:hypothetical protein
MRSRFSWDEYLTLPYTPDLYTQCTGYVYLDAEAARKDRGFLGVGVMVGIRSGARRHENDYYFVTNHHLLQDFSTRPMAVRINSFQGFNVVLLDRKKFAVLKKLDLAAAPLPYLSALQFTFITEQHFIMQADLNRLKIGLGSDVFMVCRAGVEIAKHPTRNLCALRFGNISLLPHANDDCYLVELRSVGGHSGSPVCVYETPPMFESIESKKGTFAPLFLGLNRGHEPIYERVGTRGSDGKFTQLRNLESQSNTAIASIIPAWHIRKLLYCQKFSEERFRRDTRFAIQSKIVPDFPKLPKGKSLVFKSDGSSEIQNMTAEQNKKRRMLRKSAKSTKLRG